MHRFFCLGPSLPNLLGPLFLPLAILLSFCCSFFWRSSAQILSPSFPSSSSLFCRDNLARCPLYYSYCFVSAYQWCMSTHCRRTCGYCSTGSIPFAQQQPNVLQPVVQPIVQPIIQPILPLTPVGNNFGGTFSNTFGGGTFPNNFGGGTTFSNFPGQPNIPTLFPNNFQFGFNGAFGR